MRDKANRMKKSVDPKGIRDAYLKERLVICNEEDR